VKGTRRVAVIITVLTLILALPTVILAPLGAPTAGSMIGLGGLAIAFISRSTDTRVTLYSALGLGLVSLIAVDGAAHPVLGVIALMSVAAGVGITARWHWQQSFILLPITMAFVASESVLAPPLELQATFAAAMTLYAVIVGLLVRVTRRSGSNSEDTPAEPDTAPLSWQRTWAFAGVLMAATAVTASIALLGNWGHTGGWLIMTPFLVIQPYVRDGVHKAVHRALGTVAGLLVAEGLAQLIGQGAMLAVIGYGFGVFAIIAMVKHWPYAVYTTLLTPAVVILESIGRPIEQTGYERIVATIIGVAVSLAAMAIAAPIYARRSMREESENR
jgi:hypothetical protein